MHCLSLPLLLTSQSSGLMEMASGGERHRLKNRREFLFTRFLIFSESDLPSCVESPTENKSAEK